MTQNNTKKYMQISFAAVIILSMTIGWIMAKNLGKDESQQRYKLTTDYKRVKKETYSYKPESGKTLYRNLCAKCHRPDGMGTIQTPPLTGSPIVLGDKTRLLRVLIRGLQGPLTRGEKQYNSSMPSFKAIGHTDLAHIANYLRLNLNKSDLAIIEPVEVITVKVETLKKKTVLKQKDLE